MIKIKVNGEFREVEADIKVGTLLKKLGIEEKTMASAVNMEVVKKENWDSHIIKDGDKVEFLHFVAGG